jgi:hypothetical protein
MVQLSILDWDSGSSMVQPNLVVRRIMVQPSIANLVVRRIMVQPSIPNLGSESSYGPAKYSRFGS